MPKLLIFAPCDNVLYSGNADSVSLIVMMTMVSFPKPPDDQPQPLAAPMRWFVFANWAITDEDKGKIFEQRIRLVQDDKTHFDSVQVMETLEGKLHHRMIAGINIFPLIKAGTCELKIDLREKGSEIWEFIASYPLLIIHT